MDEHSTLWRELWRRASALRRRYGDIPGGPEDTRSLICRTAAKFPEGGLPNTRDHDHLRGIWTKALCSVLNDAWRRQKTARDHGYGTRVPLKDELSLSDERAAEIERQVTRALCRLAQIDEEMGESKARILTLRYLDGFTWREIAAEQESSITTVRREAQFAIAWMRDHLGEPRVPSSKSP